ncbi:hypothetical protein C8R44DRAFT_752837 [Mycena epipterygia]|nr:hypothetical protein C8R44DRAFT_752837 [Mycena epipterygia]
MPMLLLLLTNLTTQVTCALAAWYMLGQDKDYPDVNFSQLTDATFLNGELVNEHVNVQGDHYKVICEIGAASTILLKNTNGALPLQVKNIKWVCVYSSSFPADRRFTHDQRTVDEIQTSMQTGILTNPHNEVANRMGRSVQRQSAIAKKTRESRGQGEAEKLITEEMAELLQARRESSARTKELNVQLKLVKGKSERGKPPAPSTATPASSSGRMKSVAASGKSLSFETSTTRGY